jgi:hypothetical protein
MLRVMRRTILVFVMLFGASLGLFLAHPTLLTVALIIAVVGGFGAFGFVRFVEWLQDRYGMDERRRDLY